jgi:hypothetical protein
MSFRLFIYYCALCGAGGAFIGWGLGRLLAGDDQLLTAGIKGMFLGMFVALALSLVDSLWNLSLRQVVAVAQRVTAAVLVGGVGGFFGGLISHGLYSASPLLGFALGWTITGLLIGAAPGVFDLLVSVNNKQDLRGPRRKVLNGVLGGTVGGFLGGILSMFLRGTWTGLFESKPSALLWSPSATGFVALGACIGLLIALAQVFLKEAWLHVEAGFRAGRQVILSRPVVTLGRAESCDIGLFGDAGVDRIHARLIRQGQDYVLSDAGSAGGTYVNGERLRGPRVLRAGDAIRMGNCLLRFGERRKKG